MSGIKKMRELMMFTEMCKEAKDVQKKWEPKVGDCVMFTNNEDEGIVVHIIDSNSIVVLVLQEDTTKLNSSLNQIVSTIRELIWLPTQRQLQEMLFPNNYFWHYMGLNVLNEKMAKVYGSFYSGGGFENGEEFWMAVVMWELYRKVWDICMEKWIKSGK